MLSREFSARAAAANERNVRGFREPERSPGPRVRPARMHTPAADTSAPTRAWVSRRDGRPIDPRQTDTRSDGACSLFHRSPGTKGIQM